VPLVRELRAERTDLRRDPLGVGVRREPRERVEVVASPPLQVGRIDRQREEQVRAGGLEVRGQPEVRGEHADYLARRAVHLDAPPEHVRVAAEPALEKRVAQ
jgi:hypothetical protein